MQLFTIELLECWMFRMAYSISIHPKNQIAGTGIYMETGTIETPSSKTPYSPRNYILCPKVF